MLDFTLDFTLDYLEADRLDFFAARLATELVLFYFLASLSA